MRHAEQRETCGDELFALDELADQLVTWKVGGLPNSAVLYHLKPIEMDANAASALFVRCSYSTTLAALLASEDAVLARSNTPPGDLRDLPAKSVAFMFALREIAEDPARSSSGLTFSGRLRLISPRWGDLWDALVTAATPTEGDDAALARP